MKHNDNTKQNVRGQLASIALPKLCYRLPDYSPKFFVSGIRCCSGDIPAPQPVSTLLTFRLPLLQCRFFLPVRYQPIFFPLPHKLHVPLYVLEQVLNFLVGHTKSISQLPERGFPVLQQMLDCSLLITAVHTYPLNPGGISLSGSEI